LQIAGESFSNEHATFCRISLDATHDIRQNVDVRVISLKLLRDFWLRHPDAEKPLRAWYRLALGAQWSSLRDARATFPHADGVVVTHGETLTVFNIGGNKYRLIVRIGFDYELINIRHVLTHAQYDRGNWKE
jgi:mRNA interferase HigB